jgi:hypothetical protein
MLRRTTTYVVTAQFLIGTWRQGPGFCHRTAFGGGENSGPLEGDPESHHAEHTATAETLADRLSVSISLERVRSSLPDVSGGREVCFDLILPVLGLWMESTLL